MEKNLTVYRRVRTTVVNLQNYNSKNQKANIIFAAHCHNVVWW